MGKFDDDLVFAVLGPNDPGIATDRRQRLLDEKALYDELGEEYPAGLVEALAEEGLL